jgi:hypothetical protein
MNDKLFLGSIVAMFAFFAGHPYIALFIFWLSII